MKYLVLIFLLITGLNSFAQYPFEKYPKPNYKVIPFKVLVQNDSQFVAKSVAYKQYAVMLNSKDDMAEVSLYHRNKIIKKFKVELGLLWIALPSDFALYAADIDGNGLVDFKLKTHNNGSGLAGSLMHKLFLFNKSYNKFSGVHYIDFSDSDERDLNNDGRYEIITQHYLQHTLSNQAYWVFDLFNFSNGKLVNVSAANNYPILVQFLYRDNYKITSHFTRRQMRKFSIKAPRDIEYFE